MLAIPLIASLVLLLCFWWLGDVAFRTKVIFTIVWAVLCAGWFSWEYGMLFAVALTALDGILWWLAFGPTPPGRRL